MDKNDNPIAFLDSGVGGISVLNEALKIMPNENYIFFGDSVNAPYGTRTTEEVRALTEKNVEFLLERGSKAIVIACNTATSAAADYLRNKYKQVPIIGVEPALKPAALNNKGGKVLVMATPMTLKERKFNKLMQQYQEVAQIIPVPCGGLMEFVEQGILDGSELEEFLYSMLTEDIRTQTGAIVLGCTHYPFIKDTITKVIGYPIEIYDGGMGTAKQLQRTLERSKLLRKSDSIGQVEVINTLDSERMITLSEKLLMKE
ncbi:glutamate racemase [Clostridium aminobutyricum]|uniref:Glutamate racemase n=1 Tax=Clostridium aminobutyricum TaxID=33953 RepID=A0A939IK85_CLOAM|nr:glutamate racemase [Clostridium aminobutyricum]MBN7774344.1 glutamate racemase [Clostridium aminobutyricum]